MKRDAEATNSAMTTTNIEQTGASWHGLPLEIRREIYSYLVPSRWIYLDSRDPPPHPTIKSQLNDPRQCAGLYVNSEFRRELSSIFRVKHFDPTREMVVISYYDDLERYLP